MVRVLVTRPQPFAANTAIRLKEMGFEPVLFPLFRVVFKPTFADLNTIEASAVAITSKNAVAAVAADFTRKTVPLYVVGNGTAEAARQAGFQDIRIGAGTGVDLALLISEDLQSGRVRISIDKPLLYLAGTVRRPELESMLDGAGVPVKTVEVYGMEKISHATDFLISGELSPFPEVVLLYSANTARRFAELVSSQVDELAENRTIMVCLSEAVARALPQGLRKNSAVASAPTEDALLEILATIG